MTDSLYIYNETTHSTLIKEFEAVNKDLTMVEQIMSACFEIVSGKLKASGNEGQAVEKMVKALQYHDILRQRLEHIREIHDLVIKELRGITASLSAGNLKYLTLIPRIATLNILQLEEIDQEFKVSGGPTLAEQHFSVSGVASEIRNRLERIAELFNSGSSKIGNSANGSFQQLESIYTMISERRILYKVFDLPFMEDAITHNETEFF